MSNLVAITTTKIYDYENIKKNTYNSLNLLSYKLNKIPENIIIKVNLCYYWDYTTGETTDPRVVSSVIDYIREMWNKDANISIVESDASAVRMKYAFKMLGYEQLSINKNIKLVNLSEESSKKQEINSGKYKFEFEVPNIIKDSDLFITIPKPKYHITGISCALKNQFGCNPLWKKNIYHSRLNESIVALNKLMKPDLVLVDGLIVSGAPVGGVEPPRKMGLIISGLNPLTVDYVVAQIMGFKPLNIGHIKLAIEEKIGKIDDISILGEDIYEIGRQFPKPIKKHENYLKRIIYNTYLKIVGTPLV